MKKMKYLVPLLVMALLLGLPLPATQAAQSNSFKDTGKHWAEKSIAWGIQNGIITGYSDGTFKPNKNVSEAEFISMLLRTFKANESGITAGGHWSDSAYAKAGELNFPVAGAADVKTRSAFIDRLSVAEIIVGANGYNYTGAEAIHYLLGNGLSNGKTSKTIDGYEGLSSLTRAEAITFLQNIVDSGMTELKARPAEASDRGELPALDEVYIIGRDHLNLDYEFENDHAVNEYRLSNGETNVNWTYSNDNQVKDEAFNQQVADGNFRTGYTLSEDGVFTATWSLPLGYGTLTATDKDSGEVIAQKRILTSYNNIKNIMMKNGTFEVHLIEDDYETYTSEAWGTYEMSWNLSGLTFRKNGDRVDVKTTATMDRENHIIYFNYEPFSQTDDEQVIHFVVGYDESTIVTISSLVVPGKK